MNENEMINVNIDEQNEEFEKIIKKALKKNYSSSWSWWF